MATIIARSAISVSGMTHKDLEMEFVPSDDALGPHWVFSNEDFQFKLLLTDHELPAIFYNIHSLKLSKRRG